MSRFFQAPDPVWLEDLTWTGLRDLRRAGTTIVIPIGNRTETMDSFPVPKRDGDAAVEIQTRAGHADISLKMAVDPHPVQAAAFGAGKDLDVANGVHGDPRRSTAEIGRWLRPTSSTRRSRPSGQRSAVTGHEGRLNGS